MRLKCRNKVTVRTMGGGTERRSTRKCLREGWAVTVSNVAVRVHTPFDSYSLVICMVVNEPQKGDEGASVGQQGQN